MIHLCLRHYGQSSIFYGDLYKETNDAKLLIWRKEQRYIISINIKLELRFFREILENFSV